MCFKSYFSIALSFSKTFYSLTVICVCLVKSRFSLERVKCNHQNHLQTFTQVQRNCMDGYQIDLKLLLIHTDSCLIPLNLMTDTSVFYVCF